MNVYILVCVLVSLCFEFFVSAFVWAYFCVCMCVWPYIRVCKSLYMCVFRVSACGLFVWLCACLCVYLCLFCTRAVVNTCVFWKAVMLRMFVVLSFSVSKSRCSHRCKPLELFQARRDCCGKNFFFCIFSLCCFILFFYPNKSNVNTKGDNDTARGCKEANKCTEIKLKK